MQGKPCTFRQKSSPACSTLKDNTGFTLIEILVTIVIISIVLGIALLNIDVDNFDSRLKQEVGRMARMMELTDQQAIYESQEMGLLINDDGYGFYIYNDEKKWVPVDDALLKPREIPEDMEIVVSIDGLESRLSTIATEDKIPQIVFSSSGEWTTFEILLTHRDRNDLSYILTNAETGQLEIERVSNDDR